MFRQLKNAIKQRFAPVHSEPPEEPLQLLNASLTENLVAIRGKFGSSFDLVLKEMELGPNRAAFLTCEGMVNKLLLTQSVINPILSAGHMPDDPAEQFAYIYSEAVREVDQKELFNMGELLTMLLSGFAVLLIDGAAKCQVFGVQGFPTRSISEPNTETQERGSREGFVESLRVNTTMIRRRLKTPDARFELLSMGATSNTPVCLCYLSDRVQPEILDEVKTRLKKATLDTVLESGYLQPFLDHKGFSLFTGVGVTERPDTLCAKISEGRVGVLVDGTPFALVVPYLFIENFHSLDDYANRPFYAVFIRALKMVSFFLSILLPGMYVAIGSFHQELFPESMLYDIVSTHARTPFPIMLEALIIHFIYEIMREAGLRLPKQVGHAVSIVGALVIGDAAVSAGLIAPPMLIVVALTAITSFVTPALYEPVAVLRFAFIIIGGTTGLYGIMIVVGVLIINLCSINPYGVPYLSAISPFEESTVRDTLLRFSWKSLGKRQMKIQNLSGSEKKDVSGS